MTEQTYNGWTNRATWLTGLHFGEAIKEDLQDQVNDAEIDQETSNRDIADHIEAYVSAFLDEEVDSLSSFLQDMLDLSEIDYYDLARSYSEDLDWLEEEEED